MLLMEYPPSKRLKEYHHDAGPDPFSDDEDFTQDDFNEIDVIASQAVTGNIQGTIGKTPDPVSGSGGHSKPEGRRTFALSSHPGPSRGVDTNKFRSSNGRNIISGHGQSAERNREGHYIKLEAKHASLLEKLKEVEEEILMKNGEIRVLRDSLGVANQEKEQQRLALYHQEREKAQAQSEKEKELSKKIQSLQSELHFKEAEINKMKNKLQHSERGGKLTGTPSKAKSSPKMNSVAVLQPDRDCHISPGGSPFITKETFTAQLPVRPSPMKSCTADVGGKQTRDSLQKEISIDIFPTQHLQQGSALLNLLLQHPLDPSSLGLCHLLCISPDSLSGLLSQHSYICPGSLCSSNGSSSSSSIDTRVLPQFHAHFSHLQSLAMSGLSSLALSYPTHPKFHTDDHLVSPRSCPGAVHLLPLLEHHISLFCQTLETVDSSVKNPLRGISLSGSSASTLSSNMGETLVSQEDIALASLKAVRLIVSESDEAVQTLLSQPSQEVTLEMEEMEQSRAAPINQQPSTSKDRGVSERQREDQKVPQHPLFKRLVQLADPTYSCSTTQKQALVISSLATLSLLAQRADEAQLQKFDCLLAGQTLAQCLSLDSTYNIIFPSVRLLTILVSSDDIAEKLCSHLYSCPFLKIFQHATSRPDKTTTDDHWFKLQIEMIRFLSRLFTQRATLWTTFIEKSCQCNSEVVRTLVVLLHRQWLSMHGAEWHRGQRGNWDGPGVTLLREALMLLYWLLQNDSSFSDHCLDVLHMYEKMIPAIRDTFRMIPNLTESEELALDEICRSVAENVEDMDVDAGF